MKRAWASTCNISVNESGAVWEILSINSVANDRKFGFQLRDPFLNRGNAAIELIEARNSAARCSTSGCAPVRLWVASRFIAGCRKGELKPAKTLDQSNLRVVFSTGSPLLPEDYDWVYSDGAPEALLGSIAGGTDICGCFVGSTPLLPVRRGEIQCRFLGVDAVAYGDDGQPVSEGRGELVCRQPLPSMPVSFWQDPDGERYRDAYFNTFPGVWAHGDFIEFTEHGGAIIYGRSDATLNPGGVRIGTAEIYRQVETVAEVKDSLVVGRQIDGDVEVVLLVVPADGQEITDDLLKQLKSRIREGASPRHVPKHIVEVNDIPYTRSGKKVELAVARLINGSKKADNRDALGNPEALDHIRERLSAVGLLPE